jgi:hypothetical protein
MKKDRAQQEMVGFVLIVVIVVVALMIFLVISLRQPVKESQSIVVKNLLYSVMESTTECVVSEPYFENMRDLIKRCYEKEKCNNFNAPACTYLNDTISSMMNDLTKTENSITSYEMTAYWENEEKRSPIFSIKGGSCNKTSGNIYGADELISTSDGGIKVNLKICSD